MKLRLYIILSIILTLLACVSQNDMSSESHLKAEQLVDFDEANSLKAEHTLIDKPQVSLTKPPGQKNPDISKQSSTISDDTDRFARAPNESNLGDLQLSELRTIETKYHLNEDTELISTPVGRSRSDVESSSTIISPAEPVFESGLAAGDVPAGVVPDSLLVAAEVTGDETPTQVKPEGGQIDQAVAPPEISDQDRSALDVRPEVPDELQTSVKVAAPPVSVEPVFESGLAKGDVPAGVVPDSLAVVAEVTGDQTPTQVEPERGLTDQELKALLESDADLPSMIAQPAIPQSLRPPGVPIVRPGRLPATEQGNDPEPFEEDPSIVGALPKPIEKTKAWEPPKLLPEPEPEPRVVYIVPFTSVMVPREVSALLFDRFVDLLNTKAEGLDFTFVILKEGLEEAPQEWLLERKYVTGEIYAYVEESGCCSTDLRSMSRIVYRKAHQEEPVFAFEYPFQSFFDHEQSTLQVERRKLAESIANTLANEFLMFLKPS
ncbi:MAG: hypothetical protein JRE16_11820 [Deltaproteobacteria bacterium]|nr:hypothetical protein [Deltaproteobacteria bacterium]